MDKSEERENSHKKLAILALLLALLALALGFGAFSKTVDIEESQNDISYTIFKGGVLSINPDKPENGKVFPTSTGGALADPATLTENGIININVHFTKPGQSATYSFFGVNPSKEATFLNNITFGTKECKAGSNTTSEYMKSACDDIVMIVSAKNDSFKGTVEEVDNHILPAESNEPIAVTIKYLDKGKTADGYFSVDFGTTTLTYTELD